MEFRFLDLQSFTFFAAAAAVCTGSPKTKGQDDQAADGGGE